MDKTLILGQISQSGVVPVIRTESVSIAERLIEAVIVGGVDCVEITMTIPDAISLIGETVRKVGSRIAIGAGTVCSADDADRCIDAGASFIVSPFTNVAVIDACRKAGVLVVSGALTPSEIFAAWRARADVVKVFPANALGGPRYIRSIKAVFPQIKLIPTGGVTLENAPEFISAGAFAVGIGSELADPQLLAAGPEAISANTAKFLAAVAAASNP
jgi:2-dehydro-3-deoxyphosphogluconate aldolase/(4S)-4-hydroxy-2-oxoglutarate aldolase